MNPQTKVQNTIKTLIRGLTPLVYSTIAAAVARFGYHVSLATVAQIVAAGTAGLSAILIPLERQFPWFGVFLGWLGAPAYAPSAKNALIADLQAKLDALTPAAPVQTPPVAAPSDTAQVS